ncbi:glycosyltransferases [Candidatus Scalindua japonica]|uniref:Glycosyltransferases n=2 Tax=Candidatus Scalindua japonica TaxID=1284222 RepID=A0A286TWA5_9BACT|nr:glycosyltransferases [Candidatus Scalindua japonica]
MDYKILYDSNNKINPIVSIVTTVYDRISCLKDCIKSVKNLSFTDYEHIVVADSPPEELAKKIKNLIKQEDVGSMKFVNLTKRYNNWGIAPATIGLQLARGKYICFLSDDNGYNPDHLDDLVEILEKNPDIGFAYSSCKYAGRKILNSPIPKLLNIDLGQPLFRKDLFNIYLRNTIPFNNLCWDWYMIEAFIKRGVRWQHVDKESFIFKLDKYPQINGRFKIKLIILTTLWKRHHIFKSFINRSKELKKNNNFDIEIVAVGSEGDITKEICETNCIHYLEFKNNPLGKKWNYGLNACKKMKPDYVMILGSDDLISNNLLEAYLPYCQKGYDFLGVMDAYFFDTVSNQCIYWSGYTNHRVEESIGAGRLLSHKLLDKSNWKIWDDNLNNCLDRSMMTLINKNIQKKEIISLKKIGAYIVDIKSKFNMGKLTDFKGKSLSYISVLSKFVKPYELENIKSLSMNLSAIYTIYNGVELLNGSIDQIYDHVNSIIIIWQKISNYGKLNQEIVSFIKQYEGKDKFHLYEYKPDLRITAKRNEIKKHSVGLDIARTKGSNYFLIMATDEYYDSQQFARAKDYILENNFDATTCKMYTYYKKPTYRLEPIERYEVPFICKLRPDTKITSKFPVYVDSARGVGPINTCHSFAASQLMMHHFSHVRKDISDKLNNAASKVNWKNKIHEYIRYFNEFDINKNNTVPFYKGHRLVEVENKFNIETDYISKKNMVVNENSEFENRKKTTASQNQNHTSIINDIKSNQTVKINNLILNGKNIIQVTNSQNNSTPGIKKLINLNPHTNYTLNVSGFKKCKSGGYVKLWIGDIKGKNIVWDSSYQLNEKYETIKLDFNSNDYKKLYIGILFCKCKKGDQFYIHSMTLIKKNSTIDRHINKLIKIVLISVNDFAGSGYRIAEAIRKTSGDKYDIKFIKIVPHKFNYKYDICVLKKNGQIDKKLWLQAQQIINEADILHFKGDDPITHNYGFHGVNFKIPMNKPKILTVGGSAFRRHLHPSMKGLSIAKYSLERMKKYTDLRIAFTPDLNYPEFDSIFVPQAINSKILKNIWKPREIPIIGHSPSSRRKKGTDSVFLPALKKLKKKGYKFNVKIIEGVSHRECLSQKRDCTIFWDQCNVGFYGNSAIEAAQYGIPTMSYISEIAIRQAGGKLNDIAIINFEPTVDGCSNAIEKMLNSDLHLISKNTKEWVDSYHSYEIIGKIYEKIYSNLLIDNRFKKSITNCLEQVV